jgi:hypothetical protein
MNIYMYICSHVKHYMGTRACKDACTYTPRIYAQALAPCTVYIYLHTHTYRAQGFVRVPGVHKDLAELLLEQWKDCEHSFESEVSTFKIMCM